MIRCLTLLPLAASFALAACGEEAATPLPEMTPAASASPLAEAPDLTPAQLVPEAEKGEKGARNVLLSWARALEVKEFDQAWALFGDGGAQSGMTSAQYAAQFADYADMTVAVAGGMIEGGAGSLYYEVPTTITGTTSDGQPFRLTGTTVLRRVNDVDGASPAQLRWHLSQSQLAPD